MGQVRWTYVAPSRAVYRIGIYHGNKSGHVIIYINNRISTIDFSILKPKVYSFLVEEQLCEISIDPDEHNNFSYEFKINKQIQTPAAIESKRIETRHLIYSILFLIGFVLLIVLLTVFLR